MRKYAWFEVGNTVTVLFSVKEQISMEYVLCQFDFFKSYQLHIQASTNSSINLVYERGQIYYRNKPISARFHELVEFVTFDRILQWSFHLCSNSYDNKPYSIQISRTVDTPRNAIGYRRIYTQTTSYIFSPRCPCPHLC